jgi:hypothetical protein
MILNRNYLETNFPNLTLLKTLDPELNADKLEGLF